MLFFRLGTLPVVNRQAIRRFWKGEVRDQVQG